MNTFNEKYNEFVKICQDGELSEKKLAHLMNLFNELFPKNENIYSADNELATIPLVEKEFEISHPMPQEAFNIIEELLKAGKIDNCENKLKFFLLTGQLSKEQIDAISEMGVSTIPEL